MDNTPNQKQPEQRLEDNFKQIKAEGSARSKRITKILRTAFAESLSELKVGASNVAPDAKDASESVTRLIRDRGSDVAAKAMHTWKNGSLAREWRSWFLTEIQAATRAIRATWLQKKRTDWSTNHSFPSDRPNSISGNDIEDDREVRA